LQKRIRMIDTHCHLENEAFDEDREAMIERAKNQGIHIVSSAIEKRNWEKCCKIAERHINVHAAIGLDPTNLEDCHLVIDWIRQNLNRIIAIGETGLDHYFIRDHDDRNKQKQCFEIMINLALEVRKPLQVHSRSAGKAALEILAAHDAMDVHLHAFDGKASLARSASRDLGFYFSIPTSVIRSPQKQKLVKAVEVERLLLETDSPVLGPDKNLRNNPLNLPLALHEVAKILKREEEEIRQIILENTLRLYPIIGFI
jgi:TatD DNase family protein